MINNNRKAMVNQLQMIAFGIIALIVIVAIGMTVITKLGDTTVSCDNEAATTAVTNEVAFINATGYTLANAGVQNFVLVSSVVSNRTDWTVLAAGNYTISAGVITNATAVTFTNASINYTYSWTDNHSWNTTTQTCLNVTGGDPTTGIGTAYTSLAYGNTQLGSTGLLSWLPAVIALLVGVFFLMYFAGGKGGKGKNY